MSTVVTSRGVRLLGLLLLLQPAVAAGQQLPPASAPVPASQPARKVGSADRENDGRIRRLEQVAQQQQQQLDLLHETVDDMADQLGEGLDRRRLFSVYGFFDLTFAKVWIPGDVVGEDLIPQDPHFIFGNLNTYLDFNPWPSWRVLTELRLTLNPKGDTVTYENAAAGTVYSRVDVTTGDNTHYGSQFDYGAVAIERAQVEWSRFEWLQLTAGLFLTPIGIWNIDHGSPAQIRVTSPNVYVNHGIFGSFFPKRQLGLMLHGHVPVGSLRLGYALTLTNGGGPTSTLDDMDADKAVGGRLELSGAGAVRWELGLSGYTGMWTDYKLVITTNPRLDYVRELTTRYRESILAADLTLVSLPWELRAELLSNFRHYKEGHRPPASAVGASGNGLAADNVALGGYVNLAYHLPLRSVALLVFGEAGYVDRNDTLDYDNICELALGLNWRIRSNVVLKLEYSWFHWPHAPEQRSLFTGIGDMHGLQSQLAVAF